MVEDWEQSARVLLEPLHPNEFALKEVFQRRLPKEHLSAIYDFGPPQPEDVRLALEEIFQSGTTPNLDRRALDALKTTSFRERYGDPDIYLETYFLPLFCNAALIQMAVWGPEYFFSEPDTLARFTSLAITLGEEVTAASASLLAWRYLANPGTDEDPSFFALAILILAIRTPGQDHRGVWLNRLGQWVLRHESYWGDPTTLHFHMQIPTWRSLVSQVIVNPVQPHPVEAVAALAAVGELVMAGA